MKKPIHVTKRDGSKEPIDLEKMHKVVFWATQGLTGVSASEVEIRSHLQFYDGIKSSDIQETLIKAAADLISEESPNYQYVAGRLVNYHLRKMVYGGFDPCTIIELVRRNVAQGFYDQALLDDYTEDEFAMMEGWIDHSRDEQLTFAAMEQFRGKYLVQNRVTKTILETPQMTYMLIAATLFSTYPKDVRMNWVREYYESISRHEISLPTPIMAGVRTPQRQFSSCVLIETDDSLNSISATSESIVKYVSMKAGIGIGAGRIRAIGSPIRNGDAAHTGVVPFFKMFQAATRSCSQGGVRNGAATLYYPIWHYEVEDMLVLKNNKGTEDNRVRHMDYGVQFNKLFYERLITGGDITLLSPNAVPGLYDAFFNDYDRFKELYEKAEKDPKVRKKSIKALTLFSMFMNERQSTGRVYLQNVDNVNQHSSFDEKVAPIHQSNLCAEIDLPTVPMGTVKTERKTITAQELNELRSHPIHRYADIDVVSINADGTIEADVTEDKSRIALCTLSAINWGVIKDKHDFERPCRLAVRALDALLDYQSYPVLAAQIATLEHRPLGVGIINLAYWLAKNGFKYSDDSSLAMLDEYAEAWSYYLIKASVELAKEKGACLKVTDTKYAKGIVPIDTRKVDVDELVPHSERMDWASLREDLKTYGIRNATLMALMPAETSAQIANATNGIEPPRAYVSVKQSKDGVMKQVVPELKKLKKQYELLWDQRSPEGYLNICAILQKYIDQGISVNTSYNPKFYEDEKVPMSDLIKHLLLFYKRGGKQLYYLNMNDQAGEIDVDKLAGKTEALAPEAPVTEADCDSCTI